jgi:hypothetical protein
MVIDRTHLGMRSYYYMMFTRVMLENLNLARVQRMR